MKSGARPAVGRNLAGTTRRDRAGDLRRSEELGGDAFDELAQLLMLGEVNEFFSQGLLQIRLLFHEPCCLPKIR